LLVNGIELLSAGAPMELANTTLLVAQHGAFLMGHPEIKFATIDAYVFVELINNNYDRSVFYDGEFILAPLIKWIAARERLAAFSGQAAETTTVDHSQMSVFFFFLFF
jgi:hypothetical protein